MAEPLSSIAAAIGLADAGLRTLVGIYGVAMDLKEVPKRLRDVHRDLDGLLGFVTSIYNNASQANGIFAQATPAQLQRATNTLGIITQSAAELTQTLRSVVPSAGDSKARRGWRALVSLSKQKDILLECDRLVRLKQDLQLELDGIGMGIAHASNNSLREISAYLSSSRHQMDTLHPKVDDIHGLAIKIQSSLDQSGAVDLSLRRVEESSERIEALARSMHQLLLSNASEVSGSTGAIGSESERRQAAVMCCRKLAEYPVDLQHAVDKVSHIGTESQVLAPKRNTDRVDRRCSCLSKRTTSSSRIGPITTRQAVTIYHEPSCSQAGAETYRSDYMVCLSMRPFFNRAVQLFFTSSQQRGAWVTSWTRRPYRIVPRNSSPAFQLFEELNAIHCRGGTYGTLLEMTQEYDDQAAKSVTRSGTSTQITTSEHTSRITYSQSFVEELGKDHILSWLSTVRGRLQELFQSGEADPKDTDEFGNTLLHEVVFCWSLLWDHADAFKEQIQEISGYLYDMGADASGICPVRREATRADDDFLVLFQTKVDGFRPHTNPTVADLAFYQLLRPGITDQQRNLPTNDRCPFPSRILLNHSVDLAFYHLSDYSFHGDTEVGLRSRLLERILCSWDEFDFLSDAAISPLHEAILSRSMAKLVPLIGKYHATWEKGRRCNLSVMECALGWPEGLATLCNAGYRTNLAFEQAIFRDDALSARSMMSSNTCIDDDLIGSIADVHSTTGITALHKTIISWLVESLSNRRTRLQNLAMEKLPTSIAVAHSLDRDMTRPPDSISYTLVENLEAIGVEVPRSLRPTVNPLFHTFDASSGASVLLAESLYDAGFKEINALNRHQQTPLEVAIRNVFQLRAKQWPTAACNTILWMINHGSPVHQPMDLGTMGIRPLFALSCLYSTRYNEKRRWTQWHWENSDDLAEILEILERAAHVGESMNFDYAKNFLRGLGFEFSSPASSCAASESSGSVYSAPTRLRLPLHTIPRGHGDKDTDLVCSDVRHSNSDPEYYSSSMDDESSEGYESSLAESDNVFLQRAPRNLILGVARRDLNLEDGCNCYCSANGCLPTHMIPAFTGYSSIKTWVQIQDDIFSWIHDCGASYRQSRKYVTAACRLEVFSRLGMAHTCCRRNSRFEYANVSEETRLELQEEDAAYKNQLELIMHAFDVVIARHTQGSLRLLWAQWWRKLDTILPPLLPWERGLQYCSLSPPMSSNMLSSLLQLRELRHATALMSLGYRKDVDFLDVIKDHIPGLLNVYVTRRLVRRVRSSDSLWERSTSVGERGGRSGDLAAPWLESRDWLDAVGGCH